MNTSMGIEMERGSQSPPDERCEICGCYICADPWRCREALQRLEWLEEEAELVEA